MTSAWCCCIKGLGTLSEVAEALFCIKYRYQRGGVLNSYLTIRVNPGHPWLSLWFRLCRAGIVAAVSQNAPPPPILAISPLKVVVCPFVRVKPLRTAPYPTYAQRIAPSPLPPEGSAAPTIVVTSG